MVVDERKIQHTIKGCNQVTNYIIQMCLYLHTFCYLSMGIANYIIAIFVVNNLVMWLVASQLAT